MLVLTRRAGQSLMLGDPLDPEADENAVEVVVVEVRGDHVRLSIRAPREVTVHRSEVYQEIADELAQRGQKAGEAA